MLRIQRRVWCVLHQWAGRRRSQRLLLSLKTRSIVHAVSSSRYYSQAVGTMFLKECLFANEEALLMPNAMGSSQAEGTMLIRNVCLQNKVALLMTNALGF